MAIDNIFSGLKVVDLASFIAGPSAAVILSDFGADVVKVEPPDRRPLENWCTSSRRNRKPNDAYPWHLANRNKRGITLDLKSPSASRFSSGWSSGPTCLSSTRRIPRASD